MILDIISCLIIFSISSLFVYYICDINNLSYSIKSYSNTIYILLNISSSKGIDKSNDIIAKLDKVSIEGIKLCQIPIKGEHKPLKLGIAKIDNEFQSTNVQNFVKFSKNYFK